MKRITQTLMIYSLTALTLSPMAFAEPITIIPIGAEAEENHRKVTTENQFATVPRYDKTFIASIGTFYGVPSSDFNNYYFSKSPNSEEYQLLTVNPGHEFGFDVALGYIFDNSANSLEAFFRDINTSDNAASDNIEQGLSPEENANTNLDYHLRAADIMFGQYMNLGDDFQIRLAAGAAYAEIKRDQNNFNVETNGDNATDLSEYSKFTGFGPRLTADLRYAFEQGFGVVGSVSMAYFIGQLKNNYTLNQGEETFEVNDTNDDQGVMNFRGNIGLDYIYQFEDAEQETLGLEIGYLIDYYDDSVRNTNIFPPSGLPDPGNEEYNTTVALSFSGPYLYLKGAF